MLTGVATGKGNCAQFSLTVPAQTGLPVLLNQVVLFCCTVVFITEIAIHRETVSVRPAVKLLKMGVFVPFRSRHD